jgi:DNA-binding transcriptional regulator GbsR (MarR family)
MELNEGKNKFITSWGNMCINWGFNKTMGQVHALLLISPKPICTDKIMEKLQISRGNVNINTRTLVEWGLVHKHFVPGERKEFFLAEKDMWKIFTKIVQHRRRKELDPMLDLFKELKQVKPECKDSEEFVNVVKDLSVFTQKADNTLDRFIGTESSWLLGSFIGISR